MRMCTVNNKGCEPTNNYWESEHVHLQWTYVQTDKICVSQRELIRSLI